MRTGPVVKGKGGRSVSGKIPYWLNGMWFVLFFGFDTYLQAQCSEQTERICLEPSILRVSRIMSSRDDVPDTPIGLEVTAADTFLGDYDFEINDSALMASVSEEGALEIMDGQSIVVPIGFPVTYRVKPKTIPGLLEEVSVWIFDPSPPMHPDTVPTNPCPEDSKKLIRCSMGYLFGNWKHAPGTEAKPMEGTGFVFNVSTYPKAGLFSITHISEIEVPHCCPQWPYRIEQTRPITVVEVDSLLPNGGIEIDDYDGNRDTKTFVLPYNSNLANTPLTITVTATPNPKLAEADLPPEWRLTGGMGSGKLTQTVDRSRPTWDLKATCGTSEKRLKIIYLDMRLHRVIFRNTQPFVRDSGAAFTEFAWKDENLDGDALDTGDYRSPFSYPSSATLATLTRVALDRCADIDRVDFYVKAEASGNLVIPAQRMAFNVITSPCFLAAKPEADSSFGGQIAFYRNFEIKWFVALEKPKNWVHVGTSDNRAYISLKPSQGNPVYESPLYIGCLNGAGAIAELPAHYRIWRNGFQELRLLRAEDDKPFHYWFPDQPPAQNLPDLMVNIYRNGSCLAMSLLQMATYRAQGMTEPKLIEIKPRNGEGLLVAPYPFLPATRVTSPGLLAKLGAFQYRAMLPPVVAPVQGGVPTKTFSFRNHFIVNYQNFYFDPSYGNGPFETALEWEDASLAGFYKHLFIGTFKKSFFRKNVKGTLEVDFVER